MPKINIRNNTNYEIIVQCKCPYNRHGKTREDNWGARYTFAPNQEITVYNEHVGTTPDIEVFVRYNGRERRVDRYHAFDHDYTNVISNDGVVGNTDPNAAVTEYFCGDYINNTIGIERHTWHIRINDLVNHINQEQQEQEQQERERQEQERQERERQAASLYNQGVEHYNQGVGDSNLQNRINHYRAALGFYEQAARLNPNHKYAQGYADDVRNRWLPQAEQALEREQQATILFNQGVQRYNQGARDGNLQNRIDHYRAALNLYRAALGLYEQAARLNPNHKYAQGYANEVRNRWLPEAEHALAAQLEEERQARKQDRKNRKIGQYDKNHEITFTQENNQVILKFYNCNTLERGEFIDSQMLKKTFDFYKLNDHTLQNYRNNMDQLRRYMRNIDQGETAEDASKERDDTANNLQQRFKSLLNEFNALKRNNKSTSQQYKSIIEHYNHILQGVQQHNERYKVTLNVSAYSHIVPQAEVQINEILERERQQQAREQKASTLFNEGVKQYNLGFNDSNLEKRIHHYRAALDLYKQAAILNPNNLHAQGYADEVKNRWLPEAERALAVQRQRMQKEQDIQNLRQLGDTLRIQALQAANNAANVVGAEVQQEYALAINLIQLAREKYQQALELLNQDTRLSQTQREPIQHLLSMVNQLHLAMQQAQSEQYEMAKIALDNLIIAERNPEICMLLEQQREILIGFISLFSLFDLAEEVPINDNQNNNGFNHKFFDHPDNERHAPERPFNRVFFCFNN